MGNLFSSHSTVTGVPLTYTILNDAIDIELVGANGALGTFRVVKRGAWKEVKEALETNPVAPPFNVTRESLPEYFNRHPCKMQIVYRYGTGEAVHVPQYFLDGRNYVLNVTTSAANMNVYAIRE